MTTQQQADLLLAEYQLKRVDMERALRAYTNTLMLRLPTHTQRVNPAVVGGIVRKDV